MLTQFQIKDELERVTIAESCFDARREYIGLSQLADCPRSIVRKFIDGHSAGVREMLRCYKGYQMERDLVRRLQVAFPGRIKLGGTISGYGGQVQGHPDFSLDGFPGDCKSVNLDEHLPVNRLPRKVEFQMNGYMYFSKTARSYVVYESRQTGLIRVYDVVPSAEIVRTILNKIDLIRTHLSFRRWPNCECGKCLVEKK